MHFLNLTPEKDGDKPVKAVLLPVPLAGPQKELSLDKGPADLLHASGMLSVYDAETDTDYHDLGVRTEPPLYCAGDQDATLEALFRQASSWFADNKLVGGIGGSQLISMALIRAALSRHEQLGILHLGAHPHTERGQSPTCQEENVMGQIREICPVLHIGVRGMSRAERASIHPDTLIFARDIYASGLNAVTDAIDLLHEKVYLSIHLDVMDPACMPAVACPEPGGLDWYTVNALLNMVTREKRIIGFDISGLLPSAGERRSALLAAKLVYKTLIHSLRNSR